MTQRPPKFNLRDRIFIRSTLSALQRGLQHYYDQVLRNHSKCEKLEGYLIVIMVLCSGILSMTILLYLK